MRTILFLSLLIGLLNCQNAKTDKNTKNNTEKVKLDKVEVLTPTDTCENIKQIINIINKTLITNRIDFIDTTQFVMLLKKNDNYTEGCYFPNNQTEYDLLYKFTDSLVKMSSSNEYAIYLLTILKAYNSSNAEYSEYFMTLIPEIASDNLLLFLKAINRLNDKNRRNTIGELESISDKKTIEKLKIELESIKDPSLQKTIDEVREFLLDESHFDLK
jgi:hypothetical protein